MMEAEKVNEIVAHFIGLFETAVDEARIRCQYLQGPEIAKTARQESSDDVQSPDFRSEFELKDYDPEIFYELRAYDVARLECFEHVHLLPHLSGDLGATETAAQDAIAFKPVSVSTNTREAPTEDEPPPDIGPASAVSHNVQANVLDDDEVVNVTGAPTAPHDPAEVDEALTDFLAQAWEASPLAQIDVADTPASLAAVAAGLKGLAAGVGPGQPTGHDDATAPSQDGTGSASDAVSSGEPVKGDSADTVLVAERIEGIYVNGIRVEIAAEPRDDLADAGLVGHAADAKNIDKPIQEGTVTVEAGANVVGNVASVVSAVAVAPVTAVMGDYHQIDVITQCYVYADRDTLNGAVADASGAVSATVALNIASFERSEYEAPSPAEAGSTAEPATFPTSWRVSVVEGDLSFVHWVEQYNFVSDNDRVTVTTTGVETTILTGGNTAVNFASFLGIAEHYDLIIVGGQVLDLNLISQISILYDNDEVEGVSAGNGIATDEGGNLVWNMASIENEGCDDRFEPMRDYFHEAVDQIRDGDGALPEELMRDQNFEGYASLHVLYITGNLYDINVVQQISILGDADAVTYVVSKVLEEDPDASVTVDTGDNAVVNIAEIIDYDSFSQTTYVGGEVYSDAILIQSGIIDGAEDLRQGSDGLPTELIAFIGEDEAPQGGGDDENGGTDSSADRWSDVMQTVLT